MKTAITNNGSEKINLEQLRRKHAQSKVNHISKRRNDQKFKLKEALKIRNSRLKKKHIYRKGDIYFHKVKGEILPSKIIF